MVLNTKDGSRQGRNLALTCLFVPSLRVPSRCSGWDTPRTTRRVEPPGWDGVKETSVMTLRSTNMLFNDCSCGYLLDQQHRITSEPLLCIEGRRESQEEPLAPPPPSPPSPPAAHPIDPPPRHAIEGRAFHKSGAPPLFSGKGCGGYSESLLTDPTRHTPD